MFYTTLTQRDMDLPAVKVEEMIAVVARWGAAGCTQMPDGREIAALTDELNARRAELETAERRATLEFDGTPHCDECDSIENLIPDGKHDDGSAAFICAACKLRIEREADQAGDWREDAEAHYQATRGCYTTR
jgi:hypothetical protein